MQEELQGHDQAFVGAAQQIWGVIIGLETRPICFPLYRHASEIPIEKSQLPVSTQLVPWLEATELVCPSVTRCPRHN